MSESYFNCILLETEVACCRCEESFHLLDETHSTADVAEKITCVKCTHAPCAKCKFSDESLMKVTYSNKLAIKGPKQEHDVFLRICCNCGQPDNVDITNFRRRRNADGDYKFQFKRHNCSACDHKCCRLCACFIEPDAYVNDSDDEVKDRNVLGRRSSVSSSASFASIRSIRGAFSKAATATTSMFKSKKPTGDDDTESLVSAPAETEEDYEVSQDLSSLVPDFEEEETY